MRKNKKICLIIATVVVLTAYVASSVYGADEFEDDDVDAINAVLKHYEGYICALSAKRLYDEDGNPYLYVDEGIRRRLETKLITAILSFNAA